MTDHFGPHGEGKCLHHAVAALRARVEELEADLKADRTEARDQEQRLKVRITALEGEVHQKSNELDECSATIKSMSRSEQLARFEKLSLTEKPREGTQRTRSTKKKNEKKAKTSPGRKMCMTPQKHSSSNLGQLVQR